MYETCQYDKERFQLKSEKKEKMPSLHYKILPMEITRYKVGRKKKNDGGHAKQFIKRNNREENQRINITSECP